MSIQTSFALLALFLAIGMFSVWWARRAWIGSANKFRHLSARILHASITLELLTMVTIAAVLLIARMLGVW